MIKSLRWRLQIWYGLVLLAAVGGFAAILYARARIAKFGEIDARLVSAVQYLDASLRSIPGFALAAERGSPPLPKDGPRPKNDRFGKDGRKSFDGANPKDGSPNGKDGRRPPSFEMPPRRPPEKLIADLSPPPDWKGPSTQADQPYFAIWRSDGTLLKAAGWSDERKPDAPPTNLEIRPSLSTEGEYREAALLGPHQSRILVGQQVGKELAELDRFAWMLAAMSAGIIAVGLMGGWVISARIVRPIARMSSTASVISATNLSERIDASGADAELAGLAGALNDAFERLQAAFARQAQFTADASHELRTPLAVIRSSAELALSKDRSAPEYREAIQTCSDAAKRMTTLVDGLLTLARSDAGTEAPRSPIAVHEIVAEVIEHLRPVAAQGEVKLEAVLNPVEYPANPAALTRLVSNLIANAIHYNRRRGVVRVSLTQGPRAVKLKVEDTGVGISESDREQIFDRFFRVDKARARRTGGAGLGLAICKSVVDEMGGTITVHSELERGTTFRVRFPLANGSLASDSEH